MRVQSSSCQRFCCFRRSTKLRNRIALLPLLDFLFVAVELGIVHRVGAKTVGAIFEKMRSAAGAHGDGGTFGGVFDGEHVHAVHRPGGNLERRSLQTDIGFRFGASQRCAHGIKIIFAAEQHRQLPQRGEIHRFVKLAFSHRSFAKETGRDLLAAGDLVRQREARRRAAVRRRQSRCRRKSASRRRTGASTRRGRGCSLPLCRTSPP